VSKLWVAPTGGLTTGHVLDVAKAPFERALRDYDSQLYVRWNPRKVRGWGCWEIRRRPNRKSVKEIVNFKGASIVVIDYVETDFGSSILDAAFLNYDQLRKLQAMDTWAQKTGLGFVDSMERKEQEHREAVKAKQQADLKYAAGQMRTAVRDFKDMLQSGLNPAEIATHWDKAGQ
jgi:hypothetical protein